MHQHATWTTHETALIHQMRKLQLDFDYSLTSRAHVILPDILIVANFRPFHGSMPVHFVDDYSKSQEINLWWTQSKTNVIRNGQDQLDINRCNNPYLTIPTVILRSYQNDQTCRPNETPYEVVFCAQPTPATQINVLFNKHFH